MIQSKLRGARRLLPALALGSTAALSPLPAPAQAATNYVSPFTTDVTTGRTDMGVDFCLNPGDPIRAVGDGVVTGIQKDWYAGQPYVWYELTSGPDAGHYVYVAEQIRVTVTPGQTVSAGQVIARYIKNGSCIETGWSEADGETTAAATTGYSEGEVTTAGVSFARFLISLGVPGSFELTPTGKDSSSSSSKAAKSKPKPKTAPATNSKSAVNPKPTVASNPKPAVASSPKPAVASKPKAPIAAPKPKPKPKPKAPAVTSTRATSPKSTSKSPAGSASPTRTASNSGGAMVGGSMKSSSGLNSSSSSNSKPAGAPTPRSYSANASGMPAWAPVSWQTSSTSSSTQTTATQTNSPLGYLYGSSATDGSGSMPSWIPAR